MSRSRYSRTHSPRGWRTGNYALVGLPAIDSEDALFPRALWGTTAMEGQPESETFRGSVRLVRDPYGFVVVGICAGCGGRAEGLIDGRRFADMMTAGCAPAAVRELADQVRVAMAPVTGDWVAEHEHCATAPRPHEEPAIVGEFIDRALQSAIRDLGRGETVHGHLMALDSRGMALALPIHDVPASSHHDARRTNELAARKASLRQLIRAREGDIIAAVALSEAWGQEIPRDGEGDLRDRIAQRDHHPWEDPRRSEVLMLTYATPTHGRACLAPIHRRGDTVDSGPADVGQPTWSPNGQPSLLLDGLFATKTLHPMAAEERRDSLGTPMGPSLN